MSVRVRIPTQLRTLTEGESEVVVDAADVQGLIDGLDSRHPGFAARILDEQGAVRKFINIYVDGEDIRFIKGIDSPLESQAQVAILPSVAGG